MLFGMSMTGLALALLAFQASAHIALWDEAMYG